jgi:3-oxoadipate enol-lactonase/4-carboxymuconolactone decarboxylase
VANRVVPESERHRRPTGRGAVLSERLIVETALRLVAQYGAEALSVRWLDADRLGVTRFAYAGISLGGAVGAHLAIHHPKRITGLALVCSSARFGEPAAWRERAALVRAEGTEALAAGAPGRWFTAGFTRTQVAGRLVDDLRAAAPEGYAACCDALAAYDLRPDLHRITAPTLVVAGRDDPATPPGHARELAGGIPGATLLELPGASHLAPAERPQAVLGALLGHFEAPADDGSRHAEGMAVRRAVLGDAHVDRAVARTTEFTADFQAYITRCAWGEIWTRPGLDRRTRSCPSTSPSPTSPCSPRPSPATTPIRTSRCSTPTRRPRCAVSGGPSTSRTR